ncbi:MAG: transcription elongation factor GreA [Oscillospiraceae bacterium]|nr:transcription elongation factor GreA [Oscillospiraceae bacterium]
MNNNKYKMSQARLDQLKEELNYLETVREKEVAEQIREARSFGDLSENSEYDEAKTEQGKLYSKIAELRELLENAEVIEITGDGDAIGLGFRVTLEEVGETGEEVFEIVGSQESDPRIGRISEDSPIGRALMGKHAGDEILVEAPAGDLRFRILSAERR